MRSVGSYLVSSAGLLAAALLIATSANAAPAVSPVNAFCLALAADPGDLRKPRDVPGVADKDVTEAAVSACAAALKLKADDPQIAFLLGRADLARGYYADAIVNLGTAAKGDYAAAELRLGDVYAQGKGVGVDEDAAIEHYVRASDLGDPSGLFGAVKARIAEGGDVAKLFPLLQKAGLSGSADAWRLIGDISETSPTAVPSATIEQALMAGFAAGNTVAGLELGAYYQRLPNPQATTAIYTQLASSGSVDAMLALGDMNDDATGIDWLTKAANKGNAQAMYALATAYRSGSHGLQVDLAARLDFLQSAADAKYLPAIVDLGFAYMSGEGTDIDYDKARALLERGSKQKSAGANLGLGLMYENGNGVTGDAKKAYRYYSAAIDQGGLALALYRRAVIEDKPGDLHSADKAAMDFLTAGKIAPALAAAKDGLASFTEATRIAVQKRLIAAGKYSSKPDGNFGPMSIKALMEYWG